MIKRKEMQRIVKEGFGDPCIATMGSHSALDIARGASDQLFNTVVLAKRGRERTYSHYYKSGDWLGCVDKTIVVGEWSEVVSKKVMGELREDKAIFIPHRALAVYLGYDAINNLLAIPMFGNRALLQSEERSGPYRVKLDQDRIMEIAGIPTPRNFRSPGEIDRQVIVKATASIGERGFERNFEVVRSREEYEAAHERAVARGTGRKEKELISKAFRSALIQEYLHGNKININYFYSPLSGKLEIMGTDIRYQFPGGEELAHSPVSLKESLLEKAYTMGEALVAACRKACPPGIIGPFALQTVSKGNGELLTYDVSFRIPGSPDSELSPYTMYLYGYRMSYGTRIAKEIRNALQYDRLGELIT